MRKVTSQELGLATLMGCWSRLRLVLEGFGQDVHHLCCPGTPDLSAFCSIAMFPPFLFLVSRVLAASPSLSKAFSPGLELLL